MAKLGMSTILLFNTLLGSGYFDRPAAIAVPIDLNKLHSEALEQNKRFDKAKLKRERKKNRKQ